MGKLRVLVLCTIFAGFVFFTCSKVYADDLKIWQIQSIDTMKYSRDLALQMLTNPSLADEIDIQTKQIAQTGANYIAIDTPYDEKFIPVLSKWVSAARKYHLHVWFRGNFSRWEGWFGEKRGMSFAQHQSMAANFILKHPDLFENGDIFTSCPECENGSQGDPRQTGGLSQYRAFIIDETQSNTQAFNSIHKQVQANYWSMNYDVAKLVMNPSTVKKIGGVVVIDHYVSSPAKYQSDIDTLAAQTQAKIVLGEFGAPIAGIDKFSDQSDQANWLKAVLTSLYNDKNLVGLNYWVNLGGSTALWNDDGTAKKAVSVLTQFYSPLLVSGNVVNQYGQPLSGVSIRGNYFQTLATNGSFKLLVIDEKTLTVENKGLNFQIPISSDLSKIVIHQPHKSFLSKLADILKFILHLFRF